jgi:hypothetical protein
VKLKDRDSREKLTNERFWDVSISRREFLILSTGLAASGVAGLSSYGKVVKADTESAAFSTLRL